MMQAQSSLAWAVEWRSLKAGGEVRFFVGRHRAPAQAVPENMEGHDFALFRTRRAARDYIRRHYGYIAQRADLQAQPHGWRMPRPVRVRVTLEAVE